MRLILCHRHLYLAKPPQLPDGIFGFVCREDFSLGPLHQWNNQLQFQRSRSDFWLKTPEFDLPDGSKMDYNVWLQAFPRPDLVDLIQGGVSTRNAPDAHALDDLAPKATSIEIWCDQSATGCAFLWYLCTALEDMGVDHRCVSFCIFQDGMLEKRSQKFWSDMLLGKTERDIPAVSPSSADWRLMAQYWKAITKLPVPIDPELLQMADGRTLDALDVMINRHPNPETGLTNLQVRLLCATKRVWSKMARVIAEAMCIGWDADDPVGDAVLQAELEEMARLQPPLIEIVGTGGMRFCEVRLTTHGASMQQTINS